MERPPINPKLAIYSLSLVVLLLILLLLKLMGFVNWSWWVITAPMWGPPIILIAVLFYIAFMSYLEDPIDFNQRNSMLLTHDTIVKLFTDCLAQVDTPDADVLDIQGVVGSCQFSKSLIDQHRPQITALLAQLPPQFNEGWTFMNLVVDKADVQWGDQQSANLLVCLGKATGQLETTPPELNSRLPGGMPYVFLKLDA